MGVSQTVAAVYSETFILGTGCDSVSNVTLVVNPLPTVDTGIDQALCVGGDVTLTATGANTYAWDNSVIKWCSIYTFRWNHYLYGNRNRYKWL